MKQKTILITGGTGFAGSHLAARLISQGETKVHVTAYGVPDKFVKQLLPPEHIHEVNLTDIDATRVLFQTLNPDQVYHLAAFSAVGSSFDQVRNVMHNNTTLQLNILESMKDIIPQARLLSIGSADEYGVSEPNELPITELHPLRPQNPYAVSKVSQDLLAYAYCQAYSLDVVRVRPFNHTGERQTTSFVIPAFIEQVVNIERGHQKTLKVGNIEAVRDFTDVKDMVAAYQLLMETGKSGDVYNVGSGIGISLRSVVELLQSLAKVRFSLETDTSRLRPSDVPVMVADTTKITNLGWQPTIPLRDTLSRLLQWFRQ